MNNYNPTSEIRQINQGRHTGLICLHGFCFGTPIIILNNGVADTILLALSFCTEGRNL